MRQAIERSQNRTLALEDTFSNELINMIHFYTEKVNFTKNKDKRKLSQMFLAHLEALDLSTEEVYHAVKKYQGYIQSQFVYEYSMGQYLDLQGQIYKLEKEAGDLHGSAEMKENEDQIEHSKERMEELKNRVKS